MKRKDLLWPNGPCYSENLLPKAIPHNYQSPLTWRARKIPRLLTLFVNRGQRAGGCNHMTKCAERLHALFFAASAA